MNKKKNRADLGYCKYQPEYCLEFFSTLRIAIRRMEANRKLLDSLMGIDRDGVKRQREITVFLYFEKLYVGFQRQSCLQTISSWLLRP